MVVWGTREISIFTRHYKTFSGMFNVMEPSDKTCKVCAFSMKGPAEAPVLRGKGLRGRGDGDLPHRRSSRLGSETTNESLRICCRYKTEVREFLCSFIRRLHWSSNICRSMPSHVCGPSTTTRLSIGYPVCQGILDLGNKHVQLKSPPAIPRNSKHLPL